jgi:tRNA dimethylallyltransferase
VDRDTRNQRIDKRLKARLNEGMVDEVKRLLDSGIKPEDLIYYGLEYKFVTQYLIGELTYSQMEEGLAVAIHQFAKRQMTWFRGMERKGVNINWIKI